MAKNKKGSKIGYLLLGLLLLAIGICFIIFGNSLKTLAITVGAVLMVFSAVYLVIAIANKNRGAAFAFKIIFGALGLIAGLVTILFNEGAIDVIVSVLCLLYIIDASLKLNTVALSKRFGVGGWWVIMISALLTIAGSFYLIKFPPENINTVSIILGIVSLIAALSNLLSLIFLPLLERNAKSDIYYEMYRKEFQNKPDKN